MNLSFKPCYKWTTFNTVVKEVDLKLSSYLVLNLVINGLPSIPGSYSVLSSIVPDKVLNLVINGLPSIPLLKG